MISFDVTKVSIAEPRSAVESFAPSGHPVSRTAIATATKEMDVPRRPMFLLPCSAFVNRTRHLSSSSD